MPIFSKLMDVMRLTDDDYDDNIEFDIDEEIEAAEKKAKKEKKAKTKKAAPVKKSSAKKEDLSEDLFDDDLDDLGYMEDERPAAAVKRSTQKNRITKVKPRQRSIDMELTVIKPTEFDNASEITEALLDGLAVIINLEGLDDYLAQRILDFTYGTCYAMNGNIKSVSRYIIIVSPSSIDITGDIEDMLLGASTSSLSGSGSFTLGY